MAEFSVVITTYHRNDVLPAAIESALAQTVDTEVIVVDGSGAAHAEPVVDEYDVRYVPQPEDHGPQADRSRGAALASGRYVNFLDDDDRLHPEKLERQRPGLEREGVGVSYTGMDFEGRNPHLPAPDARGDVLERALAFDLSPCVTSTMCIDRAVLEELLPLAHNHGADDLGLIVDLALRTRFEWVDEVLVTRGVEAGSRKNHRHLVEGREEILEHFADIYESHPTARRRAVADTARLSAEFALREGDRYAALVDLARALRADPSLARLVALAGALAGERGYDASKHLSVRLE